MTTDNPKTPARWQKTDAGYTLTEPKWGANITFHSKESKTEKELDELLRFFYENTKTPLRKGGNYMLLQPPL